MSFVENFKVEYLKQKGLISTWDWGKKIPSQLNLTTIIKIFYPNDVLLQATKLSNPRSTKYVFKYLNDANLKICLNISISEDNSVYLVKALNSYETCIPYTADNWPSVPMSLGSSLAGFVVLLLIVGLIFFTQKLGKKRRIMDKKTSTKRKTRDSYMYFDLEMKVSEHDLNDNPLLSENQEQKSSAGNTAECECNTSKMDCESVCDIESIESMSHGEQTANIENNDYEIIKCDCGLIHLVGTELECDDFLQKPVYYSPHVPLAPQDTVSVESNSSQ